MINYTIGGYFMEFKAWKNGLDFTLGVELELRFLDKKSKKLKYCAKEVKKELPDDLKKYVHDEFSSCLLELVSPVCKSVDECMEFLEKNTKIISKVAKKKGASLVACGIYPDVCEGIEVLNQKRYKNIKDEFGVLLDDFNICGIHIHNGFTSSKKAIKAYNLLINYTPIFICLLANSPFFNKKDTKLLSYRISMFDRLSRSGIPPYFKSFKAMQKEYDKYKKAKIISSESDIWWDLRIKPSFGTLEFRIGDSTNDFKRLKVAILLYRALCLYAQKVQVVQIPMQILKQNRWNAIRYGFDGFMYETKRENLRDFTLNLIKKMRKEKIFEDLEITEEFELIKEYINRPNLAQTQLKLYDKKRNFNDILDFGVIK